MPVYEYECLQCGHRFDYLVLRTSPEAQCPECGKKELKQLISLCATSSEESRQANLNAAHKKAAAVRTERRHEHHKHVHEHLD